MKSLQVNLWHGDCQTRLRQIASSSVDLVLTDPPYDLTSGSGGGGFMGLSWDATGIAFNPDLWCEVFRVLIPGAPVRIFSATRTYHRVVKALHLAGFEEVRIKAWGYGSGFPKSTNISKQIDKRAGAQGQVVGYKKGVGGENLNDIVKGRKIRKTTDKGGKGVGAYGTGAKQVAVDVPIIEPSTKLAKRWEGYGTALKPAWEPVVCARKPL